MRAQSAKPEDSSRIPHLHETKDPATTLPMIIGFGWRAFFASILIAIGLTILLRMAGCNVLIL
ncbi:MAG: hypothetical protein KF681_08645 [Bdellovibrionaceae bacterium]|nr:hypothetical protein [Pseudobdellovibrionaceae bacterium]